MERLMTTKKGIRMHVSVNWNTGPLERETNARSYPRR
jgi:hypothetical protein